MRRTKRVLLAFAISRSRENAVTLMGRRWFGYGYTPDMAEAVPLACLWCV